MIFLTTTARTLEEALAQVQTQEAWIDGVELRVDLLDEGEQVRAPEFPDRLQNASLGRLETLATNRRTVDGGRSNEPDERRAAGLLRCARSGFTLVDLEWDLHAAFADTAASVRDAGCRLIWSLHDFAGIPADFSGLLREIQEHSVFRLPEPLSRDHPDDGARGDILKCAVTPRSTADLCALVRSADELSASAVPHVVIGMGTHGVITRILTARLGNHLTFASAPGEHAAPGHLTPEDLHRVYRAREVSAAASLFAVIGNPISHSRSPHYHNARFRADELDALYVPVLVDNADSFFELADRLPLLGCSVTIPHKRAVIPYLTESGEPVEASGACNTLVRIPGGWQGTNTDVPGFLAPLEEIAPGPLTGAHALVLGAGGAARGIVYALLSRGAEVSLWNRTRSRAESLAAALASFAAGSGSVTVVDESVAERVPAIIVNTTSVGMHGEGDPAGWYEFRGDEIVYDIVYTPPETPFLRRAASAGCRIITGDRMFEAQAAAQYELYRALIIAARDGA